MTVVVVELRLPEDLPVPRQAGGAVAAEVDEHPLPIDDRRRRRVAVLGVHAPRLGRGEDLDRSVNRAAGGIEPEDPQRAAVVDAGREPDLPAGDGRGRPPQPGDVGLPDDMLLGAPGEREPLLVGVPLLPRPTKLRPVGRPADGGGGKKNADDARQEGSGGHRRAPGGKEPAGYQGAWPPRRQRAGHGLRFVEGRARWRRRPVGAVPFPFQKALSAAGP